MSSAAGSVRGTWLGTLVLLASACHPGVVPSDKDVLRGFLQVRYGDSAGPQIESTVSSVSLMGRLTDAEVVQVDGTAGAELAGKMELVYRVVSVAHGEGQPLWGHSERLAVVNTLGVLGAICRWKADSEDFDPAVWSALWADVLKYGSFHQVLAALESVRRVRPLLSPELAQEFDTGLDVPRDWLTGVVARDLLSDWGGENWTSGSGELSAGQKATIRESWLQIVIDAKRDDLAWQDLLAIAAERGERGLSSGFSFALGYHSVSLMSESISDSGIAHLL